MSNFCGGRLFLSALVALCGASWASKELPEDFADRKFDAVQPFITQMSDSIGVESFEASVRRASSLVGIHADSSALNPTLELRFSSLPLYRMQLEQNSLIISFANAILLNDVEKMYIDGGSLVTTITATQSDVSPQFVTQVVLTTNRPFSIETKRIAESVRITLVPSSSNIDQAFAENQRGVSPLFVQSAIQEYQLRQATHVAAIGRDYVDVTKQIMTHIEIVKLTLLEHDLVSVGPATLSSDARLASSIAVFDESITSQKLSYEQHQMRYTQIAQRGKTLRAMPGTTSDRQVANDYVNKLESHILSMESTVAELRANRESVRRLVSRANQADTSTPLATEGTNDLATLDMAVAHLRDTSSATSQSPLEALEVAMDTVSIAAPNLNVNVLSNAAIRSNPGVNTATSIEPPSRRSRPASHSLTSSQKPSRKMTTLNASLSELDKAQNEGMLVMAQANAEETDSSTLTDSSRLSSNEIAAAARRRVVVQKTSAKPNFNLYNESVPASEDPLRKLVNIDFKDMDLANVVSLLAQKGKIDVISSVDLGGTVTANLTNIPLGRAIEVVLRMNDFGIIEETGIYRITSYEEAVASRQDTEMVFLQNAEAAAVKTTLDEILTQAGGGNERVRLGVNTQSNIIIISGPRHQVNSFVDIIEQLDVAEQVIPTENRAFRLNYATPGDMATIISAILSENGKVTPEERSGQVIVTDIPVKVREIAELVLAVDIPVEQVTIEAMIVDKFLADGSEIGASFFGDVNPANSFSEWASVGQAPGLPSTTFEDGALSSIGAGATLGFGFIHNASVFAGQLQAQITNNDAILLANPVIVTLENKTAEITITTDFPFEEKTQSTDGGTTVSTAFKEVGTILEVTPKITFDEQIIITIDAEESTITGLNPTGVPISAIRQAQTTMRMANGQTVYIAGLRRMTDTKTQSKVPILGDIPILSLLFKTHSTDTTNAELMIFLTCTIVPDQFDELTPYQKRQYDELGGTPVEEINATRDMLKGYGKDQMRDPIYKWRRAK